jgi:hypothetical protein
MSHPLERSAYSDLLPTSTTNDTSSSTTPRGPTFLSTSTTPSPPPSPPSLSIPTIADPFPEALSTVHPQILTSLSPPVQNGNIMRQPLPQLTPLPLPPPTLKPSTRPPPSLNPPNPTTYTSPLPSPNLTRNGPEHIPKRTTSTRKRPPRAPSHSANASLSTSRPPPTWANTTKPSPKRSPSMSTLDFGPPQIPLRISSIPLDAAPRKLSLPSQKSYSMLRAEEKENAHQHHGNANGNFTVGNTTFPTTPTHRKQLTPPHLKTMKELPSPPADDVATRHAVMGSEPPKWSTSPTPTRQANIDRFITNPVIPTSSSPPIPPRNRPRGCSHSRLNSAPPTTTAFTALGSHPLTPAHGDDAQGAAKEHKSVYDEEKEQRERQDRIRFAHFDWSPTLLSPAAPSSPDRHQQEHINAPSSDHMATAITTTTSRAITPLLPPLPRSQSSPSTHHPQQILVPLPPPKSPTKIPTEQRTQLTTAKPRQQTLFNAGLAEDGSWAAPACEAIDKTSHITKNQPKSKPKQSKKHDEEYGIGAGSQGTPMEMSKTQREKEKKKKRKAKVVVEHVDLIKDGFWERRPWILSGRVG